MINMPFPRLVLTAAIAAVAVFASTPVRAAVIVDFTSFNDTGNLLTGGNTREQTFVTSVGPGTNSITVTSLSGTGAGQAALLSDSYSLTFVGDRISVDFGSGSLGSPGNASSAFGLAIANSANITTREDALFFYWRANITGPNFNANGRLAYIFFNELGQSTGGTTGNISNLGDGTVPDTLFIEKTATGYDLGYIQNGVEAIAFSLPLGGNLTTNGAAVGLYSDGRNDSYQYVMNNFSVFQVPEPGRAVLFAIGMLALMARRRA